jgi:hypothetical protein
MKKQSKKLNNKSIEPFKVKRNIKGLSYKLDLLKEMWIHSVFHAFMLQCCNQFIPLQVIETFVELNKEYEVENILENGWLAENPLSHQMKKIWYLRKHMKTRENLLNCVRTLQQFEKGLKVVKEARTHRLQQRIKVGRFKEVSSFVISLLSLLSLQQHTELLNSTRLVLSYSSVKTENLR